MKKIIDSLRREYNTGGINIGSLPDQPHILLEKWISDAIKKGVTDPNAMVLSTVTSDNRSSSRTVLMKEIDKSGLVFYSNYNSRKGKELAENPNVSILFLWTLLERQVRIEGKAFRIGAGQSDEYFSSRPRTAQLAAWASPQSELIPNREVLEEKFRVFEEKFKGKEIPRPEHWGGYRIIPQYFEFWQGRAGRLHDRIAYIQEAGRWGKFRLAP